MILVSCVNCCHNPLQSDAVGTQYGYCTQHRRLLLVPEQLTCGRHLRKDLPMTTAAVEAQRHERQFTPAAVVRLSEKPQRPVNGGYTSVDAADFARLADDKVCDIVFDHGKVDSKIATMAQLRVLDGGRAELAMLSLARAYVRWCVSHEGKWTSGLHLLWWTRKKLTSIPDVRGTDLRTASPLPPARQIELAQWALVMMRLIFVSDIAAYAGKGDRFGKLASLAEEAAEETEQLSATRLLRWVERRAAPAFDAALSGKRYEQLADELRGDRPTLD
jgi:hypothetical protein